MSVWPLGECPTVGGTGHRRQHLSGFQTAWARRSAPEVVARLRDEHGCHTILSGLARGWDTWLAQAALGAGLKLWAHVPYPQQADFWTPPSDRAIWRELLDAAWQVTYYAEQPSVGALWARNDGMIRESAAMAALWNPAKQTGGTYGCVQRARHVGRPVLHLNPVARSIEVMPMPERQATLF